MIRFILGGARSGKSRYAEKLAKNSELQGAKIFYIATAQPATSFSVEGAVDSEMLSRIQRHQADRDSHWQTIEISVHLAKKLRELDDENHCVLIDCLTLWMLNLIESEALAFEKKALLAVLPTLKSEVILVSNEVGLGVIPMGKLTRYFVDELGRLHQSVAKYADEVIFVTAGLPMKLK